MEKQAKRNFPPSGQEKFTVAALLAGSSGLPFAWGNEINSLLNIPHAPLATYQFKISFDLRNEF